jgi:hypothetical protein
VTATAPFAYENEQSDRGERATDDYGDYGHDGATAGCFLMRRRPAGVGVVRDHELIARRCATTRRRASPSGTTARGGSSRRLP